MRDLLFKLAAMVTIMAALSGCPHYNSGLPPSLRLPALKQDTPATGIFHTVMQQESLSAIAKTYGVDLQVLAEVNNLKPPYVIKTDSKIFIPGQTEARKVEPTLSTAEEKSQVKDFSGVLAWPLEGRIVSEFGVRGGTQYNGITIQAPEGAPVKAAASGLVGHVGTISGLGNVVLMEHANRVVTIYAHLKEIKVASGDTIPTGHVVGTVGTSGRAEEPVLYFEVRSKRKPRNPRFFLDRRSDMNATG